MKLTARQKTNRKCCKPFLVLPLIEKETIQDDFFTMPNNKNPGLNLFIKTWPPKRNNNNKNKLDNGDNTRPLTATLEKPTILDIRLIRKIDMSKIRKEFLNISNLCRMPLLMKNKKASKFTRPLSLPPPQHKYKRKKVTDSNDSGWEDEESSSIKSAPRVKNYKSSAMISPKKITSVKTYDANNNNKTLKIARKTAAAVPGAKLSNVRNESNKSTQLMPEPCKTCGRPDQPERFHSHPVTPSNRTPRKMQGSPKIPVKSTVQKPVAIKYKSKPKNEKQPPPIQKTSSPVQKPVHSPASSGSRTSNVVAELKATEPTASRTGSAKRTLTCYLCGREFGSASLPLHEPKCLQKWERENASLPANLRRKPPPKPDHSLNKEEWNKLAWEASQSSLAPCRNCGRTFYPDRLIVHQRSCKVPQQNIKISSSDQQLANSLPVPMSNSTPTTPTSSRPPTFECYICGKMFGSNSIKIHEKQCLKKWNLENDSLPPDIRSPPPTKDKSKTPEPSTQNRPDRTPSTEKEDRPPSARKPPLFPCYICGKLFTVNSIYIHEPQCLKMWKIENDKLPPNKRRPQPLKPDVKFTRDGKINYEATTEAIWQSHLSQLVPCKACSRTFNADRVEIHERSCKGC